MLVIKENTEPRIIIHTEKNPEDNAMLQALYSRSADSVVDHLERLKTVGSGKFMEQYYVGYGHNSIADCGFITIYLEGISMLAAKAIEDNPLFNGQESSSRYIDWTDQSFFNPYLGTKFERDAATLLEEMRGFYVSQMEPIKAHLRKLHPFKGRGNGLEVFGPDPEIKKLRDIYEKTIAAKTFDILRGFLPCGAMTNVAWTTSLRKAREHLDLLKMHPLLEVRDLAWNTYASLVKEYPSSFPSRVDYDRTEFTYNQDYYNFYSHPPVMHDADFFVAPVVALVEVEMSSPEYIKCPVAQTLSNKDRPKRTTLHKHNLANRLTRLDVEAEIDFGSFRDIQRHRGGYCSMPLVDNNLGFHPWYMEALPEESQVVAEILMGKIAGFLAKTIPAEDAEASMVKQMQDKATTYSSKFKNQYILPMGTLVKIVLSYDIPQMVYVCELRTGQTVHPTLRRMMQGASSTVMQALPDLKMYPNMDPDEFSVKRGTQDIVKVEK